MPRRSLRRRRVHDPLEEHLPGLVEPPVHGRLEAAQTQLTFAGEPDFLPLPDPCIPYDYPCVSCFLGKILSSIRQSYSHSGAEAAFANPPRSGSAGLARGTSASKNGDTLGCGYAAPRNPWSKNNLQPEHFLLDRLSGNPDYRFPYIQNPRGDDLRPRPALDRGGRATIDYRKSAEALR